MLEDHSVGFLSDITQNCVFKIVDGGKNVENVNFSPGITGSSSKTVIEIQLPSKIINLINKNLIISNTGSPSSQDSNKKDITQIEINLIPVQLNVGINEEQAIADRLNQIYPQDIINYESCQRLANYYGQVNDHSNWDKPSGLKVLELLEHCPLNPTLKKDVKIQEIAQKIVRELNGVRYIQCKSAKDRTSMGVSLEQVRILREDHGLNQDQATFDKCLDEIRVKGMGLTRCFKNTNRRKYAFNRIQLGTFPRQYIPPNGTFGSTIGMNLS